MQLRLNKEREMQLEPVRMQHAIKRITDLGYIVNSTKKELTFTHNGNTIRLFPYSGWFQGKGIKPGRGLENLLKQL